MSDASDAIRSLRERLADRGEDRLGRVLSEVLESPVLTGAVGRAFDARGKAAQAQELALAALNIPSAADIERLTRRLRSVSQRLEGIEDALDRLDRNLSDRGLQERLTGIERRLEDLGAKLDQVPAGGPGPGAGPDAKRTGAKAGKSRATGAGTAAKRSVAPGSRKPSS